VEARRGRRIQRQLLPGRQQRRVGREFVVADRAQPTRLQRLETAVESLAEEVLPGAFEFVGEAHDDSGHDERPSKGLQDKMIRPIGLSAGRRGGFRLLLGFWALI
jgi:hypothetical protein